MNSHTVTKQVEPVGSGNSKSTLKKFDVLWKVLVRCKIFVVYGVKRVKLQIWSFLRESKHQDVFALEFEGYSMCGLWSCGVITTKVATLPQEDPHYFHSTEPMTCWFWCLPSRFLEPRWKLSGVWRRCGLHKGYKGWRDAGADMRSQKCLYSNQPLLSLSHQACLAWRGTRRAVSTSDAT